MSASDTTSPDWRKALRDRWNRWRYRGACLGAGTWIQAGATVARGAITGRECAIMRGAELRQGSHLDDRVVVGRLSRIARSRIGRDCTIEPDSEVYHSTLADHVQLQRRTTITDTQIGRFTYLGQQSYLNLVTVGSFGSIGPGVFAGLGEHPVDLGTTSPAFYSLRRQCGETFAPAEQFEDRRPIAIGHDVWIGARVFVRDGVTIGTGAIVAAGAVVSHDVLPYAIVGGTPAKVLRMRFPDTIVSRLLATAWWEWPDDRLRSAQPLLASRDIGAFLDWAEAAASTSAQTAAPPPASPALS